MGIREKKLTNFKQNESEKIFSKTIWSEFYAIIKILIVCGVNPTNWSVWKHGKYSGVPVYVTVD